MIRFLTIFSLKIRQENDLSTIFVDSQLLQYEKITTRNTFITIYLFFCAKLFLQV